MEEGYGDEREPSSLISRRMINGSIIDATQWATPDVGALTDEDPECVNHFETMNLMSLVSNSLDLPRFQPAVLAC